MFGDTYAGRRVLLTGHTGFKGSWLTLWLHELGAVVSGVALAPDTTPNHWDNLHLAVLDYREDIRDAQVLAGIMRRAEPEIVFHLAAQPLVRRSYKDPLETWSTNVMGTVNLLEACRKTHSVRAIVIITSDKCYENREWPWGYRESDRLGGYDPYSASKAATELVAASHRNAFLNKATSPLLATARAGNVIGGGDWASDRLIPDMMRALARNEKAKIRNPQAARPWQHVLEALSGYLLLGEKLLEGGRQFAEAWNFGPSEDGNVTVGEIAAQLKESWAEIDYEIQELPGEPHETGMLRLECSRARTKLQWAPGWDGKAAIEKTAQWYKAFYKSNDVQSLENLHQYGADAISKGISWAKA